MAAIDQLDGSDPRGIHLPPPPPMACADENELCGTWAEAGECTKNAASMRVLCSSSCLICANIELALAGDAPKDEM